MDLGIPVALTFSDATWMNIDIPVWHIELAFAHGIILQMAHHNTIGGDIFEQKNETTVAYYELHNLYNISSRMK